MIDRFLCSFIFLRRCFCCFAIPSSSFDSFSSSLSSSSSTDERISLAKTPTFSSGDFFSITLAPDSFPFIAQNPTNSGSPGIIKALSTE